MPGKVRMDSRYVCLDQSTEFTLKREFSFSRRDWSISDGTGNLVFQTESRYMESHQRTRLLDHATGNLVLCFEKKRESSSGTWNVFSGSTEVVLFSLKDARMLQTSWTYMHVFLPSNSDTENPDYKIQRPKTFSSTFSILHGTKEVAVMKRVTRRFGSTTIEVVVFPGTNQVFVFTLIIITEVMRASINNGGGSAPAVAMFAASGGAAGTSAAAGGCGGGAC